MHLATSPGQGHMVVGNTYRRYHCGEDCLTSDNVFFMDRGGFMAFDRKTTRQSNAYFIKAIELNCLIYHPVSTPTVGIV